MSVDRIPKPCLHPRAGHQHGTRLAYMLDGCRCLPCAAANSTYENRRARLRAYGRGTPNGWVAAAPVRAHVKTLQLAGLGWKAVAAAADVAPSTLCNLLYGRCREGRRQPPARRINPAAAQRLLAVPLPTFERLRDGVVVPALGTQRRLQALVCLGWSVGEIARRAQVDRQRLDRALRGESVLNSTVRAVVTVYEQLWDQRPTPNTHAEKIAVSRARNRAADHAWAPPAAWDDETIDDPSAEPFTGDDGQDLVDELAVEQVMDGVSMRLTGRTLEVAVDRLVDAGHGYPVVAQRVGVSEKRVSNVRAASLTRQRRAAA